MTEPSNDPDNFRIVFTCVDHRTRTVLAESILRGAIETAGYAAIDVAGVGGHKTEERRPVELTVLAELRGRGLPEPSGVQRLRPEHILDSDLVLVFEREHRTELFQYATRMLERCFTVSELAAITQRSPQLIALPRAERPAAASKLRHLGSRAEDVVETWKRPSSACRAAADQIESAIGDFLNLLE